MKTGNWKNYCVVPVASAIRNSFTEGYNFFTFKHDFMAGLIVSLIALPLSMAFSIAMGLPPQQGLITVITAGFIVPLLGGSRVQISGPTAAFIVIVAPIVATHGLRGLTIITVMAGFLLIFLGIMRLGRYIEHVPSTVITGFMAGIAVVIGTLALNDLLGLGIHPLQGSYIHKVFLIAKQLPLFYWPEFMVGMITLITMYTIARLFPSLPSPLLGLCSGTISALFFQKIGYLVSTIGSRFSYILPDGTIGNGIPPLLPMLSEAARTFSLPQAHEWSIFLVPAFTIALVSGLESLLTATASDRMTSKKHNSNGELIGIGVGNILSGFFSGIPATGAIARTVTNVKSGAKTPIAGSLHALLVVIYVILLMPLLSKIPMAALAALLVRVAFHMSDYREFIHTIRNGEKRDTIVLVCCFLLTVFEDVIMGVLVGIALSYILRCKRSHDFVS